MDDKLQRLGINLNKSRELTELSIDELSLQIGITARRLQNIEAGTTDITITELMNICRSIGISIETILNAKTLAIKTKVSKNQLEQFITIDEAANILGLTSKTIKRLCLNNEIPHYKAGRSILFKVTELDQWLDMQFNKRIDIKAKRTVIKSTRFGLEPLVSQREIKEIFGVQIPLSDKNQYFVPVYYIGRNKRYRLSDIIAYLNKRMVSIFDVPSFGRGWHYDGFNYQPSEDEIAINTLERQFSNGKGHQLVPGYKWDSLSFTVHSISEAESALKDFRKSLPNKWQLGSTSITTSNKDFNIEITYMNIPIHWHGHKVARANLRSEYQDLLKINVNKYVAEKVSEETLLEVRYFTDYFYSFMPHIRKQERHCATIFYYKLETGSTRSSFNAKYNKKYNELLEQATIRVPKRILTAIKKLRKGELEPTKFTHLLRETNFYDQMDQANLLIYSEKNKILDVKFKTDEPNRIKRNIATWPIGRTKYARLVKMSPLEDEAFEEKLAERREIQRNYLKEIAINQAAARRSAIERCENNYQERLDAFYGPEKAAAILDSVDEKDLEHLVWLQKHWDQIFISDGRKRRYPRYHSEHEEYIVPIFDTRIISNYWNLSEHEVHKLFERLIKSGAIFCNVYRGIVEINPFLEEYLTKQTGENIKPRSWRRQSSNNISIDMGIRPNAEILTDLINNYSNLTIGKIFGVSSTAVKKWLKKYGIKRKKYIINNNITNEEINNVRTRLQKL